MFEKKTGKSLLVGLSLILILTFSATAQTRRKPAKKKPAKKAAAVKAEVPAAEMQAAAAPKKNSRPETEAPAAPTEKPTEKLNETAQTNVRSVVTAQNQPVYFYEFSKPEFIVSKISIEHDENGKGTITLQKKDFAEAETDPLQLSEATLARLKAAFEALNFLDSTENYQTARDYSHLGTMKISMKKDGRTRAATYNFTDNKDAKALADEYRKIGQQFVWIFDINVARENQPLDAPRLFDALDSLMRRNEISDPAQMIPFLKELSNDERIPLIARNRATKLVEKIEKAEKKK